MGNEIETPADVLQRLGDDAAKWAVEFRATAVRLGYSDMDEDWLIGWFANAIEHSGDVRRWRKDAATLRQQAGRVDEGMVSRFKAAFAEHSTISPEYEGCIRAGIEAALAQNTQGEAEGVAEIYDALPHCSERTTFTFSRDKLRALLLHAERARVPDDMVLVPREPTEAMYEQMYEVKTYVMFDRFCRDWTRMLAAAPSQRAEVK